MDIRISRPLPMCRRCSSQLLLHCIKIQNQTQTIKMESTHGLLTLDLVETELNNISKRLENKEKLQPETSDDCKQLSKCTYNTAICSIKNVKGRFLTKLHIDGFDEEQIWEQSDLLNRAAFSKISQTVHSINPIDVGHALSKTNYVCPSSIQKDDELASSSEDDAYSNEESGTEEHYAFDDDSDSPVEIERTTRKLPAISTRKKTKSSYGSKLDDQFFKLSELEEYLRIEDLKESKEVGDVYSEGDIDLFQDIPSDGDNFDEDSGEEEGKATKSSRDLMYEDFFDNPASEVEDESDNQDNYDETIMEENEVTGGNHSAVEMQDDKEDEKINEKKSVDNNVIKSAFELEQERIRKEIQNCEKDMLKPLPWHLTGEVAATNRPIDSLMHQETDFDSNAKQDLITDNALTEIIEQRSIMGIVNKLFHNTERKYKPTEEIIAYKKEVALEQTKSKKSLAQVYEDDYLKKQSKQDEEKEDPKHKEIKSLMDSLFPPLQALFTHIPKPAIPEIKIVSNLPAIMCEEVAPISFSDATLLAPEEVKKSSGQIKGQTERTETDRKRERRKKKLHQKFKEKKRLEKLESQKGNPSAKVTKLEKLQTLKKLKQHKNTKIANVDEGGKIKSSKDFFSRLQDTVDSKNRSKSQVTHKKSKE